MEYDLPPLLSDGPSDVDSEGSLSGGEAAEGEDSNQAPVLISDSSSGGGFETPRGAATTAPRNVGFAPEDPGRLPLFDTPGGLDDIDQSHDEFMDDYFEEEEDGADQLFGPRGLLAGMLQQQEYMHDPLNEGLLQQIPVQNLLEALLNSGQAALLAGGGGGAFALQGMGLAGPNGGRYVGGAAHLPGVASRIPPGLEGSARRHAISMAEQGFVTALDPARHAACAAEGVPGGRRVMSPRGAMPASPPAARPQQQQQVGSGLGGLQRADSAVLGGGLQRGDSAASQGMSRVARHAGGHPGGTAAAGAGPQGLSRLASTARSGAAAGQRSGEGPPGLVSSGGESEALPGLGSASSSDIEAGQPPLHQARRQAAAAAAGGSQASGAAAASQGSAATRSSAGSNVQQAQQQRDSSGEPPRRRQRRNAVFGQLPGLGGLGAGGSAAAGASGTSGGQQLFSTTGLLPQLEGSDSDSDEQGSERNGAGLAPHVRRQQRQARQQQRRSSGAASAAARASGGSEGSPPALESATSSDEQQQQRLPQRLEGTRVVRGAAAGSRTNLSASSGSGSEGLSGSGEESPPPLDDEATSQATTLDAADVADSFYSSGSEGSAVPGLLSDAASSDYSSSGSEAEPLGRRQGLRVRAARAAPPAPQPRQQASEDQRVVMQALTSLLPAQQDAAGWAELATYVRHSSGGAAGRARAGSAGGVQLLSRLVAAAASRFPAEAEAAGLTERPLGPPPSMAVTAAPSMTATAAASPVGTPVGSVPAAAAAAAATMAAASGAAAAAAAERQRAEQSAAQQPTAQQPAVQIGFEMPGVTFVAETPAAAAALQQELGGSVRVVAAGQEAEEEEEAERAQWQLARRPMLLTVVVPGRDLPGELQMAQLPLGVNMVSEEDYTAAFEEQEAQLDRQLQLAAQIPPQQQQVAADGASTSAAAAGDWPAHPAQAAQLAVTAAYTSLVAHLAGLRGQQRFVIASTESALRALAASGAAATQPLPPLVAAAVAAAAPPLPQQAEE